MLKKENLETPEINRKLSKSENNSCYVTESVTIIPYDAENHYTVTRSKRIT